MLAMEELLLGIPRSRRGRLGVHEGRYQSAPGSSTYLALECARRGTDPSVPGNAGSPLGARSALEPGCLQHRPHIYLKHPLVHPSGRRRWRRESHVPPNPALQVRVAGRTGCRKLEYDTRPPCAFPDLEEPLRRSCGIPIG